MSVAAGSSSADGWLQWSRGPIRSRLMRTLGLPTPPVLERGQHGAWQSLPLQGMCVGTGGLGGYALHAAQQALQQLGADLVTGQAAAPQAIVVDATGCADARSLRLLRDVLAPYVCHMPHHARIVLLAADPQQCMDPTAAAAARGVQGFVRALAKEVGRKGATANLLLVHAHALDRLAAPLAFFGSHRSCFVSGQVLRVDASVAPPPQACHAPMLANRLALVTGAAQGLGAAMAQRLAQDGAHVLCADVPHALPALQAVAHACGGTALPLDVTAADAPRLLQEAIRQQCNDRICGIDIVVHNAGITRDKTLARMSDAQWDAVLDVNLGAITRLDAALDQSGLLRAHARSIYLSSVSGIAGNAGQCNYATSKAAVIGYVAARARLLAAQGGTANALAPGFIETGMTQRMPWLIRQAGRRLNALNQGGLPVDVAEAAAFLARPDAHGISGQSLRVCGQALIGA